MSINTTTNGNGVSRTRLAGSASPHVSGQTKDLGAVSSDQQLSVSVLLPRGKRLPKLQAGQTVKPEDLEKYGPSAKNIKDVMKFAASNHLAVTNVDKATGTINLCGTAGNFNNAFGVALHNYSHSQKGQFTAYGGSLSLPANLKGKVSAVLGLDSFPLLDSQHSTFKPTKSGQAASSAFTPLQLAQAYNFPSGDGTGQTVGIVELGGGYDVNDLQNFAKQNGVSAPNVTAVGVDGAQNVPDGDPNGADGEVELDIEMAATIAPKAKFNVYFAPNTEQGFVDAINQSVKDGCGIVSISWGGPETSWSAQGLKSLNSAIQTASAAGVTVLVASGDDGSNDGVGDNKNHVDFPASSPYATGTGGTTLKVSNGKITSETVWNDGANGGAGGGGVSADFTLPSWQKNAKVPAAPAKGGGRGVPDVAGDADPETGVNVIIDGQTGQIGGTSMVAPMWAGMLARVNQNLGKNVGYMNPAIYTAPFKAGFHDITSGNNSDGSTGFKAGAGWDAASGLGSPNGAALQSAFAAAQKASSGSSKTGGADETASGKPHKTTIAVLTFEEVA